MIEPDGTAHHGHRSVPSQPCEGIGRNLVVLPSRLWIAGIFQQGEEVALAIVVLADGDPSCGLFSGHQPFQSRKPVLAQPERSKVGDLEHVDVPCPPFRRTCLKASGACCQGRRLRRARPPACPHEGQDARIEKTRQEFPQGESRRDRAVSAKKIKDDAKFAIRYQSASTVPPVNCMLPGVY